jgi:hypothetical protein
MQAEANVDRIAENIGVDSDAQKELLRLADEFATKTPDQVYSPSDLTDYRVQYMEEPQQAVADYDAWKVEKLEEDARPT